MAYDLYVGPGNWRDGPRDHVGSIDFGELPAFARLVKRGDDDLIERMSKLFDDQAFDLGDIERALDALLPLLHASLQADERTLLHKLIAVLSFASRRQQGLFCISD
ncbi:hypothetical protein PO883_03115 [Massilia sp. DJPM01]|uniref:hypothetical protein n=1 Tax=Massilia sp. DJPM01 TaxID=3024404 RepID=UPI00259F039A|nr:hypothetical protein [Massilia sp. DJPM01]MDM5176181.1 hypothetical protein [Massilia sp. DJPM01]